MAKARFQTTGKANAKKVRRVVGDVLEIPLGDGTRCYGMVLPSPIYAFFDYIGAASLSPSEVAELPVLVRLMLNDNALERGEWTVVGHVEPSGALREPPTFFKQDALNKEKFYLYWADGREMRVTRERCEGLERAAVWHPETVVERLADHYAGRPNATVETLKIR
jgi:hypothetical protein